MTAFHLPPITSKAAQMPLPLVFFDFISIRW